MLPDELPNLASELPRSPTAERRLGIGECSVVTPPHRATCCGLGSCLAVILYDPTAGIGGVIHTLLPKEEEFPTEDEQDITRFTDTGIKVLFKHLLDQPSVTRRNVVAKLVGGSEVLQFVTFSPDVGQRNVEVARSVLDDLNVEIIAADVGGEFGRTIVFDPRTGGVIVRKANGTQEII